MGKQRMKNMVELVGYLFNPEDSGDSIYTSGTNARLERLPRYATVLKDVLWVTLAFGLAVLLSQFQ